MPSSGTRSAPDPARYQHLHLHHQCQAPGSSGALSEVLHGRGGTVQRGGCRTGLWRGQKRLARNGQALEMFLAPLIILPFDEAAVWAYGDLRADLERRGSPKH